MAILWEAIRERYPNSGQAQTTFRHKHGNSIVRSHHEFRSDEFDTYGTLTSPKPMASGVLKSIKLISSKNVNNRFSWAVAY